jgi:hypothetical protein
LSIPHIDKQQSEQTISGIAHAVCSWESAAEIASVKHQGGTKMGFRGTAIALTVIASAAFTSPASSAELPVKVKPAEPLPDLPFFYVNDNRVTFSWMPKGVDPGFYSVRPDGSINGKTAIQVYSLTHFDAWAYGTNLLNISMLKSDHNDPASPCTMPGVNILNCAGATTFFGILRSTFGWNQLFNTEAFSIGPLRNVSFEVGGDFGTNNTFLAPARRRLVAGLQFAFDLPYKGYFNVAPLLTKQFNHVAYNQCGLFGAGVPGVTCLLDGNTSLLPTWAVETNYSMDLGFLPENMQFWSISGRLAWYGPMGDQASPLVGKGVGRFSTATKVSFSSEPIRLTFDASKAAWGPKYSHFVDLWVAYRYTQNMLNLDHNAAPGVCTVAATGQSTNSCTESTAYAGVTVKF